MITTTIGRGIQARLWDEDRPALPCAPIERLVVELEGATSPRTRQVAAMELMVPMGGMIAYGLLGAEFVPGQAGTLVIEARACADRGEPVDWALRGAGHVFAGIPSWAQPHIVEGATQALGSVGLSRGRLHFDQDAHDPVGSSAVIFGTLAAMLALVIMGPSPEITEAGFRLLVNETWSNAVDRHTPVGG